MRAFSVGRLAAISSPISEARLVLDPGGAWEIAHAKESAMTQATLTKPSTTDVSTAKVSNAFAPPRPAIAPGSATEATFAGRLLAGVKRSPWMLALLAPIGAAPLSVAFDTASHGFGIALACVPVLGAAAFLLSGILACVFFLDDESH